MPDQITLTYLEEVEFYGSWWMVEFPGGSVLVMGDDDDEALARRLADHLATLPAASK